MSVVMQPQSQPQLVTGSISSVIGTGGGTDGDSTISGDPTNTGRFTWGMQFSDPQLQLTWQDPIRREEYDPFSYTMPMEAVQGNDNMQGLPGLEGYWSYNGRPLVNTDSGVVFGVPINTDNLSNKQISRRPSTWNLSQGGIDPAWLMPRKNEELIAGGYGRAGGTSVVAKNGVGERGLAPTEDRFSDPRSLRALRALENPNDRSVSYFDLRAHPNYEGIAQTWYTNVTDPTSYSPYGMSSVYDRMQQIGRQYGSDSAMYLDPNFFARYVFQNRPFTPTYGSVQNAYDIGSMWAQQPALGGLVNWEQVAPWASREAAQAEQTKLRKLWAKDMKDSATFGSGLLTAVGLGLSLMGAPWQVGALWSFGTSAANGNPTGALLSLTGPLLQNFSGTGGAADDYGMLTSQSWLDYLDSNSLSGMASGATPISYDTMLSNAAPMSTTANWLDATSSAIPGLNAFSDSSLWSATNPTTQKLINYAIKGALKAAGGALREAPEGADRMDAMRAWADKQNAKPVLQRPQGMQIDPAAVQADAQARADWLDRWNRLRYGNTVIPGAVMVENQ